MKRALWIGLIASLYGVLLVWLWSAPEVRLYFSWLQATRGQSALSVSEMGCSRSGEPISQEAVQATLKRNKVLFFPEECQR